MVDLCKASRQRALRACAIAICWFTASGVGAVHAPGAVAQSAPMLDWGTPTVDEFDTFDSARWFKYQPVPPGSEDAHRSPELVSVSDGLLHLSGAVEPDGHPIGSAVGDRLRRTYGRWEVRFRVQRGRGYGAAILLWPATENWPEDGEIDLIEIPHPDRQSGINSLHNGPSNTSPPPNGIVADFTNWHTVAVDWLPDSVTYYLDGVQTWRRIEPHLIPGTGPLRLALQLDECAPTKYEGFIPCRDTTSPPTVVMDIDWVKVYDLPDDVPRARPPTEGSSMGPKPSDATRTKAVLATPRYTG
jgi:hypothetical protein